MADSEVRRAGVQDLEAARTELGVSVEELWVGYFAVGGNASVAQLRAWLAGDVAVPEVEHNQLAQALNDLRIDLGQLGSTPYVGLPPDPATRKGSMVADVAHASPDAVELAETFAEVARTLAAHDDLPTTLNKIVGLAVRSLDACEWAGISMIEKRVITSPASSGEIPRIVDGIQSETGEGPCIDAIVDHEVFRTGDLTRETRWPLFSSRAHQETGIASILAVRLFIEADTMGALNLYSTHYDAFDDTDVALGVVFAVHAAVAMSAVRREDNLQAAARSRDVIGRAKGILMAQSGADDEEAFTILRAASQRLNVKLREVAQQVVDETPIRPS